MNHTQTVTLVMKNSKFIRSRKRKKQFFELILRGSRKSQFLPGFFNQNIETYINEQLMTLRRTVTIKT
jgi:hypothetical protein